jgi:hypothetical protein
MQNIIALLTSIIVLAAPSLAAAASCPANARTASLALWAGGTIPTAKTVTGTHPCGRQLTCVGGTPGNFASRRCHWLSGRRSKRTSGRVWPRRDQPAMML